MLCSKYWCMKKRIFPFIPLKKPFSSNNIYALSHRYSGITGELMLTDIFVGPIYYQRLRHMVNDKAQVRATGPIDPVTKQPVKGRQRYGGIRLGEMERDSLLAHGCSFLIHERLCRSSDYTIAHVCKQCGSIVSNVPRKQQQYSLYENEDDSGKANASNLNFRTLAKQQELKAKRQHHTLEQYCPGCTRQNRLDDKSAADVRCDEVGVPQIFKQLAFEMASFGLRMSLKLNDAPADSFAAHAEKGKDGFAEVESYRRWKAADGDERKGLGARDLPVVPEILERDGGSGLKDPTQCIEGNRGRVAAKTFRKDNKEYKADNEKYFKKEAKRFDANDKVIKELQSQAFSNPAEKQALLDKLKLSEAEKNAIWEKLDRVNNGKKNVSFHRSLGCPLPDEELEVVSRVAARNLSTSAEDKNGDKLVGRMFNQDEMRDVD